MKRLLHFLDLPLAFQETMRLFSSSRNRKCPVKVAYFMNDGCIDPP
jgi:hypothetical protein